MESMRTRGRCFSSFRCGFPTKLTIIGKFSGVFAVVKLTPRSFTVICRNITVNLQYFSEMLQTYAEMQGNFTLSFFDEKGKRYAIDNKIFEDPQRKLIDKLVVKVEFVVESEEKFAFESEMRFETNVSL